MWRTGARRCHPLSLLRGTTGPAQAFGAVPFLWGQDVATGGMPHLWSPSARGSGAHGGFVAGAFAIHRRSASAGRAGVVDRFSQRRGVPCGLVGADSFPLSSHLPKGTHTTIADAFTDPFFHAGGLSGGNVHAGAVSISYSHLHVEPDSFANALFYPFGDADDGLYRFADADRNAIACAHDDPLALHGQIGG